MSDDLSELQRRMLARQQQHYAQCGVLNGLTLVAALLIVGFVSTLVLKEITFPGFGTDKEYAASYIRSD